jgi:hypothetical protein
MDSAGRPGAPNHPKKSKNSLDAPSAGEYGAACSVRRCGSWAPESKRSRARSLPERRSSRRNSQAARREGGVTKDGSGDGFRRLAVESGFLVRNTRLGAARGSEAGSPREAIPGYRPLFGCRVLSGERTWTEAIASRELESGVLNGGIIRGGKARSEEVRGGLGSRQAEVPQGFAPFCRFSPGPITEIPSSQPTLPYTPSGRFLLFPRLFQTQTAPHRVGTVRRFFSPALEALSPRSGR